jgi:hypothetical protein
MLFSGVWVLTDRPLHRNRQTTVGHCTLECELCRKARRFKTTEAEQKDVYNNLDHGYENEQTQLASI